jgi:hypothetical protein
MFRKLISGYLFLAVLPLSAQFLQEQRTFYGVEDGLPSLQVTAVAVGPNGDVIAQTAAGTVRFDGKRWQRTERQMNWTARAARSADGRQAEARADGLFVKTPTGVWTPQYPTQGGRSWNPRDVRAVAFDAKGRLWFGSPQGAGVLEGSQWSLYTGEEGLPYDDFTCIAPSQDGGVWFGTRMGAIYFDGSRWSYRQGKRWLPDDEVTSIAVAADGTAWIGTAAGISRIQRTPMTFRAKARLFEDEIDMRHRRTPYEYVLEVRAERAGDKSKWRQHDSDNDGLWTAMYGAGECFAWAATKDPKARDRARKAFRALKFLGEVTQGGSNPALKGFVARTILPASGPDPNLSAYTPEKDEERKKTRDALWKVMRPRWPRSADGQWYWKSDTSSDELDGHYFFYALYYDLVAKDTGDVEAVRGHVRALSDHLLDHNYQFVDHDGKPTRWGIFDPENLNRNHHWWEERGLNSLSMLTYLRVAAHITGDGKYDAAIRTLVDKHGYGMNLMYPKAQTGAGSGNQSDDEMAFMNYYSLLKYERDPGLRQKVASSLVRYWQLESPERNPFFNFVYAASSKGTSFDGDVGPEDLSPVGTEWIEDSVDTLKRYPLDRFDWGHRNSHRKDVVVLAEERRGKRRGHLRDGKVIPYDEQFVNHWNHDPWALDSTGQGLGLADGASFLLPYYMGLYHGFIKE